MNTEAAKARPPEAVSHGSELSSAELAISAIVIGNYLLESSKGEGLAERTLKTVGGIGFIAYGGYIGSGVLLDRLGGAANLRNQFDRFACGFYQVRERLELMRLS